MHAVLDIKTEKVLKVSSTTCNVFLNVLCPKDLAAVSLFGFLVTITTKCV